MNNIINNTTNCNSESLHVMEHFYTLQGEGCYAGNAAYFIRLGGCDVGCVWCDVKDSWDIDAHPAYTINEIANFAASKPARIAVVTGGEPAMQNLTSLCHQLHNYGFRVHIETSGAHTLNGDFDWITVSPKKFKQPLETCLNSANELKVVVFNKSDFKWAEENAKKTNANCKLFLQPEWSKAEMINPLIIEYIKQNPRWQLSLQTHKYINIP